jgi:hypothetical protein
MTEEGGGNDGEGIGAEAKGMHERKAFLQDNETTLLIASIVLPMTGMLWYNYVSYYCSENAAQAVS